MKKLLIGLLALGLVFSFSVPVMASDFSVSGAYRIRGWLDSNSPLTKDNPVSEAYYDQRLRIQPMFQVVDGLKVTCRFDALDGTWGGDLRGPKADVDGGSGDGAINLDANVQFDKAFVTFMTAYGQVEAGFKSTNVWGTGFGNIESFVGEIDFQTKLSEDVGVLFRAEKDVEGDIGFDSADKDQDAYIAAAVYNKDGIEAGMLYKYVRNAGTDTGNFEGTPVVDHYLQTVHILSPYVKATLGPAYVEGQIYYGTGEIEMDDFAKTMLAQEDKDLQHLMLYVMAKGDVGPGYVGGMFAYSEGDDKADNDIKGSIFKGSDWNPCHILFNDTEPSSVGTYGATSGNFQNVYLFQVFAGMSPMEKLALKASFTYAYADENQDYVDDIPWASAISSPAISTRLTTRTTRSTTPIC
ncbi:MAG: hypothetical protein JRC86_02835 [Deltaproteobacteria bacterium]|nr:hypothetical protein [Deltaproteobacteria bacterium]